VRSQLIWRGGFLFRNQVRRWCGGRLPYLFSSIFCCEMQLSRQSHRQQKPQQQHHHHNVAAAAAVGGGADFKGFSVQMSFTAAPSII